MFGFSLQKLLVLALIVAAIWYGFKWVGRLDKERKERLRGGGADAGATGTPAGMDQDLVECRMCGTYVTTPLDRCPEGRADCPQLQG